MCTTPDTLQPPLPLSPAKSDELGTTVLSEWIEWALAAAAGTLATDGTDMSSDVTCTYGVKPAPFATLSTPGGLAAAPAADTAAFSLLCVKYVALRVL